MDLYFQRHDGQAVTCEDFHAAMCDANNAQLPNFLQWYSQAGTPAIKVTSSYDSSSQTFSLKFSQDVPPTPAQPVKEPMFIPVAVGLVDSNGKDTPSAEAPPRRSPNIVHGIRAAEGVQRKPVVSLKFAVKALMKRRTYLLEMNGF